MGGTWGKWWDDISGNTARRQQEEAMRTTQQNNQAALDAELQAAKEQLDFQKILAFFQLNQANQQGNLSNTMAAQQLAGTLASQQQAANQFAQLYNQDFTNNLPQMQARLGALQALGPLMQMNGMQAYQIPTSLDTTKLTAPDIVGQFDTLSSKYANLYNSPGQEGLQQQQQKEFLAAMSDPAKWLEAGHPCSGGRNSADEHPGFRGWVHPWPRSHGHPGRSPCPFRAPDSGGCSGFGIHSDRSEHHDVPLDPVTEALQGSSLEADPVYQFRLKEAQRAQANQLAARGLGTGGVATQASTNLALSRARDETNDKMNRLLSLVNIGLGGNPSTMGTQAGGQLSSMYQQGSQSTGQALSNISNAQNQAAQNRSGIYSGLANAYGQNAANRGSMLSNYYGANSAAAQQYGNWAAQQPSGLSRIIDLGTKIYGVSQVFGGGSSSPYGYFGEKGSWSNPY
jgi:hypothetical protein